MLNRYRTIGPNDDPSLDEGDDQLLGVNEWDSPENIPPGQVQAAVNMDCTTGDAVTRGGFVCLPSLGSAAFNSSTGWESQPSARNVRWTGIAFGNGRFVAVSDTSSGSDVMYSTDGVLWYAASTGLNSLWTDVAFGNGVFVAVGTSGANRVATSTDAITWTPRTAAAASSWTGITYGDGLFVAVSYNGAPNQAMTSPDGATWTLRSTPTGAPQLESIAYGNGLYVAVGSAVNTAFAMTSPDAITWTNRTAITNNWQSVTFGNGRFVAVSRAASTLAAMSSTDGVTWQSRTTPNMAFHGVTYGNGIFAAVGGTGGTNSIMTSPDAITWTPATAPTTQTWEAIAYGNNAFVATPSNTVSQHVMIKTFVTTPTTTGVVLGSGIYSDPNDAGSRWVMLVGSDRVGFYAFGKTSRSVMYASGLTVSEQSTVVQANNQVFIFRGPDETPLSWTGNWGDTFVAASGTIQNSNHAIYSQNRLWEIVGKDSIYASDVLDFTVFNATDNSFNLSKGDSDYLVTTYPFGDTSILVFKNRSIHLLTNVDGNLSDVVATEITRQVGAIGINAVVSVGPDVVYMSDQNINLLTLTSTNNSLQHKTLPLSRNIQKIFNRVNWEYAYKVSMAFHDNKLFVALPLDNSTTCNTVVVYNFVTENWFGEWNFAEALAMAIQSFQVANYLGLQRLHAITEDGRIFIVGDGPMDVSGTTFAEITTSLTTRAYSMGNQVHTPRRMYVDLATWRPSFSITAYSNGVNEYTEEVSDQTFSRSESWIFNDSTYDLTNANDDYNRAGRKDYACLPSQSVQPKSGFLPEAEQEIRFPILTRRKGRLSWLKVDNTQGKIRVRTVGFEARASGRSNYIQVI